MSERVWKSLIAQDDWGGGEGEIGDWGDVAPAVLGEEGKRGRGRGRIGHKLC